METSPQLYLSGAGTPEANGIYFPLEAEINGRLAWRNDSSYDILWEDVAARWILADDLATTLYQSTGSPSAPHYGGWEVVDGIAPAPALSAFSGSVTPPNGLDGAAPTTPEELTVTALPGGTPPAPVTPVHSATPAPVHIFAGEVASGAAPHKIPRADSSGKLDPGWLPSLEVTAPPVTESSPGTKGQWHYDAATGRYYQCVATDTWIIYPQIIDTFDHS